jgi:hypothetical protein
MLKNFSDSAEGISPWHLVHQYLVSGRRSKTWASLVITLQMWVLPDLSAATQSLQSFTLPL